MRKEGNAERVRRFIEALGRATHGARTAYFTGGASAVLLGWRNTTRYVDLRLGPEPPGVFAAPARIKEELDLKVEPASPSDFLQAPAGWRGSAGAVGPTAKRHAPRLLPNLRLSLAACNPVSRARGLGSVRTRCHSRSPTGRPPLPSRGATLRCSSPAPRAKA
ncbi:MAG: hypothetical protein HYZ53_06370 [Planctomycetes bacterium]|nr:hypothetical protein [Planctomycetota bacterium]